MEIFQVLITGYQINKLSNIHTMEYYSPLKRSPLVYTQQGANLKSLRLSEKPYTKEYILYNSIYVVFKIR